MSKGSKRIRRQRSVAKKKPVVKNAPQTSAFIGVAAKAVAGEIRGDPQHRVLKPESGHLDLNSPSLPLRELSAREARINATMPGEGRFAAQTTVRRARTVVIRNKREVLLHSSILLKALEEAYNYKPRRQGNQPEPELLTDLGLDDKASRADIKELIEQLKQLNAHLASRKPAANDDIKKLKKHLHTFLDQYAKTVGTGAGILTIGAVLSLLTYLGAGNAVALALAWKAVNRSAP
jgi:hypothetical protein